MLEITLFLKGERVFLNDVKSYNTNKDSLLYRNTLNISANWGKSVDGGKPYIHYIAVKVMNNVSRIWHPYKTAGVPLQENLHTYFVLSVQAWTLYKVSYTGIY
jgi:hypothetical protein